MLDDDALKRTREWSGEVIWAQTSTVTNKPTDSQPLPVEDVPTKERPLIWASFLLGFWHTIQPGHGKSLMIASSARQSKGLRNHLETMTGWVISHFWPIDRWSSRLSTGTGFQHMAHACNQP